MKYLLIIYRKNRLIIIISADFDRATSYNAVATVYVVAYAAAL